MKNMKTAYLSAVSEAPAAVVLAESAVVAAVIIIVVVVVLLLFLVLLLLSYGFSCRFTEDNVNADLLAVSVDSKVYCVAYLELVFDLIELGKVCYELILNADDYIIFLNACGLSSAALCNTSYKEALRYAPVTPRLGLPVT